MSEVLNSDEILILSEILIIHGNDNRHWSLRSESVRRCNLALKICAENPRITHVFCTGGVFKKTQDGISNAAACVNYLVLHNLRKLRPGIKLIEIPAKTTITDVLNCASYLKKHPDITYTAIHVVTGDYHEPRTKATWKEIGKKEVIMHPSIGAKITIKEKAIEMIGMQITRLYANGIFWPEKLYQRVFRTI